MARDAGSLQRHGAPASGWHDQSYPRAAPVRTLQPPRCGPHGNAKRGRQRCGKDAPWKSPKADFSPALGNPAKSAGFPRIIEGRPFEVASEVSQTPTERNTLLWTVSSISGSMFTKMRL